MRPYFDSTQQYSGSIRNELQGELTRSAIGYLKSGLELFHKERTRPHSCIEPAIGNLAIAVELMLKTLAVKNNPLLLFKGLPLEVRTLFACPNALPEKDFNWRPYDIDLRSFNYETVDLNELIKLFYILFPNQRQALRPCFSLLSRCRNASLHSSLPSFQCYELERTAYLALQVFQLLDELETFGRIFEFSDGSKNFMRNSYVLTDKDKKFLSSFEEERAERVKNKVEEAKRKSKELDHRSINIPIVDDWNLYTTACPICGSEGVLTGETEINYEELHDEFPHPYLLFLADTFECGECGLTLDDAKELELAGMDICYDRPESDMDKWERDF